MLATSKQTAVTGVSVIKEGDKETSIAFMNATIPQEGNPSIGHVIQDKEAFNTNKEMVLQDFLKFDEYIYSLILNESIEE